MIVLKFILFQSPRFQRREKIGNTILRTSPTRLRIPEVLKKKIHQVMHQIQLPAIIVIHDK